MKTDEFVRVVNMLLAKGFWRDGQQFLRLPHPAKIHCNPAIAAKLETDLEVLEKKRIKGREVRIFGEDGTHILTLKISIDMVLFVWNYDLIGEDYEG